MDHNRVQISGGFCVLLAAFLLTVPLPWLLSAVFAALFHELGHLLFIYLFGGSVPRGSLGATSANIHLQSMTPGREVIATLGGPLFSLLLIFFWRQMPRVALCAAFQLFYNLLPLYPMDGGRILACFLPAKMCNAIAGVCRIVCCILALWMAFGLKMGLFPLLLGFLLLIRTK